MTALYSNETSVKPSITNRIIYLPGRYEDLNTSSSSAQYLPHETSSDTETKVNISRIERATQRTSLRGIWQGLDITEEDIDEVRKEMWSDFPRDDI